MGGIEIRPVTAADLDALRGSGRGVEGSGVPRRPVPAGRRLPVGAPPQVAELPLDFAANTDGRWSPSWSAFETELVRLVAADKELKQAGRRPPERLTGRELFTLGAWRAMEWTLGQSGQPPFWQGQPLPVCNAVIRLVVKTGEQVARGPRLPAYAEGVLAWLRWITGQAPEVVYPPMQ